MQYIILHHFHALCRVYREYSSSTTQRFLRFVVMLSAVVLFIGAHSALLYAQNDTVAQAVQSETRQTLITGIRLNGAIVAKSDYENLLLTQTDTLVVAFGVKKTGSPDPVLYRTKLLLADGAEREQSNRFTSVTFTTLPEGDHGFEVAAFSPAKQWTAETATLRFSVNNALANERKKKLEEEARKKAEEQKKVEEVAEAGSHSILASVVLWGSVFLGLIGVGAIVVVIIRRKPLSVKIPGTSVLDRIALPDETSRVMNNSSVPSQDQLLRENEGLRAELQAMRLQLEVLQAQSDQLYEANKELRNTQNRLAESKRSLEELQQQKDDIFAMAVHDIKNPASLIKGLVELLRSYDLSAEEQHNIMQDLVATSSKILQLASEISRVMAMEGNAIRLSILPFSMNMIAESVVKNNMVSAKNKNITMTSNIDRNMPDAEFDPQKIEEVLDNLVSNAIKYSHRGANVQVITRHKGTMFSVEVMDNGLGLSDADVQRAFTRGTQLSAKPTAGESSSGLGLWIVKRIIEAHNGRVWVKSQLGKGSTFAFELPYIQPKD